MATNTVWGLDIGNSAIKVVKMVKLGPTECKIVDFDIVDIPVSDDDKDRSIRVAGALATVVKNHKFGNDPVFIAVAGNVCLHREFQLPPGSEDKLADLVQYEAKQQIPFPLDQVEWGFERYEDPNGVGVALIAVRKNDIQELFNMAEQNKLNVRGITASPMALFNFIHFEFKPEGTALILDAGAKGTDFVVMNRRQVYFRTIQIAGREITRVLENKFKVPYEKAEDLKKNISKSPQASKILTVIEPTLRQLGAEVQRTIGFYKSRARGQRIQHCYLLGHTFRLPKMAETLQAQVREAPFALVEGLQRVKLDHTINPDVWNNEFPTMAVAIGLGIQGLGLSELTLNLIPKAVETEQAIQGWKSWVAASVALIMATLYYSYAEAQSTNKFYADKLVELEKAEKDVKKHEGEQKVAIAGVGERKYLAERYSRVAHDRGKLNQAFAKIAGLRHDSKPFFGADNKIFLTNIYLSRMPLGSPGGLPDTAERVKIASVEALNGAKSLYGVLGQGADPLTVAPELRPDAPLIAVISGEVESGPNALRTLGTLTDLLKKMPEVTGEVQTETVNNGPTYVESIQEFNWDGTPKTDKVPDPAKDKKTQYMLFHVILRWNDQADPDRGPAAAPAPVVVPPKAKKK